MTLLFHPFLALIATSSDRMMAQYVLYLKEELKITRSRVPGQQIHTTHAERERLLKFGRPLGKAIEELITIVTPGTFYRWVRDEMNGKPNPKNPKGGQRKPKEIRELVLKIATLTGFGLTRILGEMRKLGIKRISRQTIRNILKEEGIEPSPDRTSDTWANFVARHGETLWVCDFFSVRTVTQRGLRQMYVLVFICTQTREIIVSESTEHPNSAWVCKQADMFLDHTSHRDEKPLIVIHDRDTKFTKAFVAKLKERDVRSSPLPVCSPNLNGRCERVVGTIRWECLDKFIIFGKRHLDYLVAEFSDYYNTRRSHMERDHLPPIREEPDDVETLTMDQIEVKSYVGGLVHSFERKVA